MVFDAAFKIIRFERFDILFFIYVCMLHFISNLPCFVFKSACGYCLFFYFCSVIFIAFIAMFSNEIWSICQIPDFVIMKFLCLYIDRSGACIFFFLFFFLRHFLTIFPLILLVRHAVPTESIGAANALPAKPLSMPMP